MSEIYEVCMMKASKAKEIMEDDSITRVSVTSVLEETLVAIEIEAMRGEYMMSVRLLKHGPKVEKLVVRELESLGYYTCNNNGGGTNIFWDGRNNVFGAKGF